jgi:hypothetical protein
MRCVALTRSPPRPRRHSTILVAAIAGVKSSFDLLVTIFDVKRTSAVPYGR